MPRRTPSATRLVVAGAVILGVASGALAYRLVPEPARYMTGGAERGDGRRIVRIAFEGSAFEVPEGLLARVKRTPFGPVQQLDLITPWPYDPANPPTLADSRRLADWVLVQFERNDGRLSSPERFEKIYSHYFKDAPVRAGPELIQYDFAADSPYAGMQLFVDRQASPPVFLRCETKASSLGPVLCERRYRITDRLYVRYRFDRALIDRWTDVDRQVAQIVEQVLRRDRPSGPQPASSRS